MMRQKLGGKRFCHECGALMTQGIKPMTITHKSSSATFEMPGWYCICGESIVTAKDMDISDRQLNLLKRQADTLDATAAIPEPNL